MSLMRWDPMREMSPFREALGRFIDEAIPRRLPLQGLWEWKPSVDVVDNGPELVLRADLPGYDSDDITINVQENGVTIRGEVKDEKETKGADYQIRERSFGSFSRLIQLPAQVKPDEASASFRNGVLEVTLPKVDVPKGRTLKIDAN